MVFRKNYVGSLNVHIEAEHAIQTFDGGYIILGTINKYSNISSDIILIKLDANGDTTWIKSYGGSNIEEGRYICQTSDSGYAIAGKTDVNGNGYDKDIFIIRTNPVGDTLWTKVYKHGEATKIQQTINGDFIISGALYNSNPNTYIDGCLIKLNSVGNIIWKKTFEGSTGFIYDEVIVTSFVQTLDSGYICSGRIYGSGVSGYEYSFLIKINAAGDTIWTRTYDSSLKILFSDINNTSDGNFLITGTYFQNSFGTYRKILLVKTDSVGNVIWSKNYGKVYDNKEGISVHELSNGNIVFGGAHGHPYEAYIVETDSIGTILFSNRYIGNVFRSFELANDGGFLLSGAYHTNILHIDLIKTDSAGYVDCLYNSINLLTDTLSIYTINKYFTISNPFIQTSSLISSISSYAGTMLGCLSLSIESIDIKHHEFEMTNPFQNELVIYNINEKGYLQIFNITGKCLYQIDVTTNEIFVDTNLFTPGIYFVCFKSKNMYISKKLLKL